MCLQVATPFSSWTDTFISKTAVIIAAKNGSINVHTNKAAPNSGTAYLALPLLQESFNSHYVPACNGTGRSFFSIVSVYNDTTVLMDKYTSTIGEIPVPFDFDFETLQVHTDAQCFIDSRHY